jgi:D-alanyl-D-alanine carboxypeptidase
MGLCCLGAIPTLSPAQSKTSLTAIDRYLRSELRRQRIPGFSVAVVRNGRLLFARGYGYANLEHRVPATDSTIYQSGSLGKQFTAALVLQLADSNLLSLDDPIRRWLTEGPPRWDSVTVRQLLTHTSGIPDYTDSVVDLHKEYTENDLIQVAAGLTPIFAPGDRWSYSNTGYVLLGAIVRRVTGRFYGDLLRERIFAPLGMRTARIISEADLVPNRSDGYRMEGDSIRHQDWVSPSLNTTADGSLYLTARDLASWAIALDQGRALPGKDRELAWNPVRLNDGGSYGYGFGWMLDPMRGQPSISHTGAWQGFRTSIDRFPAQGLTVIVLANLELANPRAIGLAVAGMLEPKLVPPHMLARALPGERGPVPASAVVRAMGDSSGAGVLTEGLRRFLSKEEQGEWRDRSEKVGEWAELGCERAGDNVERLGGKVVRWCYARRSGVGGGTSLMVGYTDDWHVAVTDAYGF